MLVEPASARVDIVVRCLPGQEIDGEYCNLATSGRWLVHCYGLQAWSSVFDVSLMAWWKVGVFILLIWREACKIRDDRWRQVAWVPTGWDAVASEGQTWVILVIRVPACMSWKKRPWGSSLSLPFKFSEKAAFSHSSSIIPESESNSNRRSWPQSAQVRCLNISFHGCGTCQGLVQCREELPHVPHLNVVEPTFVTSLSDFCSLSVSWNRHILLCNCLCTLCTWWSLWLSDVSTRL